MNDLVHGFEYIRAYIDDLLILKKLDWTDHVQKLELPLNKLKEKGPKYNIKIISSDKPKWKIQVSG